MRRGHISAPLRLWVALAVILPGIMLAALLARQDRPAEAPVRIAPS